VINTSISAVWAERFFLNICLFRQSVVLTEVVEIPISESLKTTRAITEKMPPHKKHALQHCRAHSIDVHIINFTQS